MGVLVSLQPSADWDEFVAARSGASIYLRSGWSLLARDVFRHRAYFLEARGADGALQGVLPLVQQRGILGNFLTSVAFFNYGGALGDDTAVAALMERARELARDLRCSYLELRDVEVRAPGWDIRTDKVSMILELPETVEGLGKQLGSKLRSQIKRADREQVSVRRGGIGLLDAFYPVFARTMRDLGTPVYPVKFFRAILERFPDQTGMVIIDHRGAPAAAGFLVFDGKTAEIPWAACLNEAKPLGMNMRLYWEVLVTSIERGCARFDFGRSSADSGTYKFKQQWGAKPLQLHWHRWERDAIPGAASQSAKGSRIMKLATSVWQRLPLPVANLLGPRISPGLPW
jgi:FemAB-related protein (PEP-CTERM system-associated)